MPARSVCIVTLSLFKYGPGRLGGQQSFTDFYHTIPYHTIPRVCYRRRNLWLRLALALF